MTQIQQSVFDKVIALRTLTKDTGVITSRSQRKLLASLSDEDLPEVAQALQQYDQPKA